jgi:hypothetical protein
MHCVAGSFRPSLGLAIVARHFGLAFFGPMEPK